MLFRSYIAINDNYDTIDPNSINNDFAGIKNWFNEFYARDTSRKIRAVQKAKGERGVPLTVNVPYGYVKDPENPKHWLVDPEAAAIVKRIFSMCMEGRGPTQIANQLWADKVLTPTAYKLSHGRSTNAPAPEDPYRWDKKAVSLILERREYTGCTVNFKTYTNSIWDKKKHFNPVENQAIFLDTHERIIDDDVFKKVQEIRNQRHRMTRTGKSSIFSGMVYCADCGSKMQYGSSNNRDFSQDFFDCSLHKKNRSKCKGHFIRVKVLEGRVLSHVQRVTDYILRHENYFRKVMEEQLRVESSEKLTVLKKQKGIDITLNEAQKMYDVKTEIFHSMPTAEIFPGVKEIMQKIKDAGMQVGVVTGSGQRPLIMRLLNDFGDFLEIGRAHV